MKINMISLLIISMGLIYSNCLDGEVEDCAGECNGYAMIDDCGDCQVAYCYNYISHEVSFELPCEGETVMLVMPNDESNPYWNGSCDPGACLDGEVEDCAGECNGYAMIDDCGDCQVAYCYNYISHEVSFELPCEGETVMLVMPDNQLNPFWNENCIECPNILGDVNSDSSIDVSDLVLMVGFILGNIDEIEECAGDINEDGIINIVDVVQTVQYILGNFSNNATFAEIIVENEKVHYESDGTISAFQFILIHNEKIEIEFSNDVLISDYHSNDNTTNIIIILPNSNELFKIYGEFIISEIIALNSKEYIETNLVIKPNEFELKNVYPNPFNPETTISYTIPENGNMEIAVYNINGRLVENLVSKFEYSGNHSIKWNASNQPSGLYLLKVQFKNEFQTEKLFLVK